MGVRKNLGRGSTTLSPNYPQREMKREGRQEKVDFWLNYADRVILGEKILQRGHDLRIDGNSKDRRERRGRKK